MTTFGIQQALAVHEEAIKTRVWNKSAAWSAAWSAAYTRYANILLGLLRSTTQSNKKDKK
jgi:hypothetical protein